MAERMPVVFVSHGGGPWPWVEGMRENFAKTAHEFAQRLVTEIGVATIPLSAFYQEGTDHRVIRFCFAKRDDTLRAAGERLTRLRPR